MHLLTIWLLACGGTTPESTPAEVPAAAPVAAEAPAEAPAKAAGPTFFSAPMAVKGRIAPMCGPDDEILFNCDLQGGGSVSLCGSKPQGQWLQLRVGTPEAPKLAAPSDAATSIAAFKQREESDDVGTTWEVIITDGGRTTTLNVRTGEDENGLMAPIAMTVHDVAANGDTAGYVCDPGYGQMLNQSMIDDLVKKTE